MELNSLHNFIDQHFKECAPDYDGDMRQVCIDAHHGITSGWWSGLIYDGAINEFFKAHAAAVAEMLEDSMFDCDMSLSEIICGPDFREGNVLMVMANKGPRDEVENDQYAVRALVNFAIMRGVYDYANRNAIEL